MREKEWYRGTRFRLLRDGNGLFVLAMNQAQYYIYILASENDRVLYIGVTNNLLRRVREHKEDGGFAEKYRANKLVYYEETSEIESALAREKQLKKWRREKKLALIAEKNPFWIDLSLLLTQ